MHKVKKHWSNLTRQQRSQAGSWCCCCCCRPPKSVILSFLLINSTDKHYKIAWKPMSTFQE